MRECSRCKQIKSIDEFVIRAGYKDGLYPWCDDCRREKAREYRAARRADPIKRARDLDSTLRSARKRRQEVPEVFAMSKRASRYGVTQEMYDAQLERQNGICAIESCWRRATDIDHDHECCPLSADRQKACGKCFRGILCNWCNTALARVNDNVTKILGLAVYLDPTLADVLGLDAPLARECFRCKQLKPAGTTDPTPPGGMDCTLGVAIVDGRSTVSPTSSRRPAKP